ncbi:hypothetical protein ACFVW1_39120 [Streptomyces olivochromogenes]|uniref:hypothetical protein n=1 Tax=Streptomyces olivochromogenes TaxID=1963 RepID=UPI0036D9D451
MAAVCRRARLDGLVDAHVCRHSSDAESSPSIRDIEGRLRINSATLHSHYRSKEHVLAALVLLGHQELHTRLQRALMASRGGPAEQLVALARAHVLAHAEYPLLALVANAELHALGSEAAAPALALREQSWQLLLAVLDEGVRCGEFTVADPLLAAAAIVSMGRQVAHWYGPRQPYTPTQIAEMKHRSLRAAVLISMTNPS